MLTTMAEKGDSASASARLRDEFGLEFDASGVLRKINEPDSKFEFDVFDGDKKKNQARYEAIGKLIDEVVYERLESDLGLERVKVSDDDFESFVFASPDLKPNPVLVLIHGSGVVRAGQWARRLIINEDLEKGTQFPYIERAQKLGWSVLVMNTNENKEWTPVKHAKAVWRQLLNDAGAILVVAHSFGGVVVSALAKEFKDDFGASGRVKSVALTDSVHGFAPEQLRRLGVNYVADDRPVGTPIDSPFVDEDGFEDMKRVSAGHGVHEWTSHAAFDKVFEQLEKAKL